MTSVLYAIVGAALLVAGAVMVMRGLAGRGRLRQELSAQRIVFPDRDHLPAGLGRYAGVEVRTGEQARAFADLIGEHVTSATAGRTYAEVNAEWHAGGRTDQGLARLRETAFVGQSLRSCLLGAYQAWQVTTLVVGLGGLLAAVGLVFVVHAGGG